MQRRDQILVAAREEFTRNGFHATSMDDIIRAAGMSPGGVYGYFASKDAIITEIATQVVDGLSSAVDDVLSAQPTLRLADAMRELVARIDDLVEPGGRLALVVWGEAQRDPAMAALAARQAGRVREGVTRLVARAQESGELPTGADTDAVGAAAFSLIAGYLLQQRILGDLTPGTYSDAVSTLLATAASRSSRRPARPRSVQ